MSIGKLQSKEVYWERVKFVAELFNEQIKSIRNIEEVNVISNLCNQFDVDAEDLFKYVKYGEEPLEKETLHGEKFV